MDNEKPGKLIKSSISLLDILKRILIFIALIAGTAFSVRPLQLRLLDQMEKIRDDFISRAEKYWGRRIQYGDIGPSIFSALDIRNVLILREDDSVLLSVSRIRLSYSVIELLRGNIQDAFHSARIDHPVFSLDFVKDRDLGERFASYQGQRSPLQREMPLVRDFLPEKFSFRILNGEWDLSDTRGRLKLQGLGIEASVYRNLVNFKGRWEAALSFEGKGDSAIFNALFKVKEPPLLKAAMTGRFNGEYSGETEEGSATVFIPSLYGDFFKFHPLTFSCFLSDGILEIRKTHDKSPAAISLVYDLDSGSLESRLEAENFSPSDLFVFTGSWNEYNNALPFRISGNAELERKSSGDLFYDLNLSGVLPEKVLPGSASVVVKASGDPGQVTINTLNLRSSYGDLKFRGGVAFNQPEKNVSDIIPFAPYGSLSLANFRLRGNRGISGDLHFSTEGREISVTGENLTAGNSAIQVLNLSLYQESQGLSFALSAGKLNGAPSAKEPASAIALDGFIDYEPRHIQASLKLDSFSLDDFFNFAEPLTELPALPSLGRSALGDMSLTTEVFFTTDYEHVLYNAPEFAVLYKGIGGEVLTIASLSGTGRRFELSEGVISWDKGSADISCSLDFSDPDDISFSFGAVYRDLTYFVEGMILDQKNVSVIGSYGLQGYLSSDDSGVYSGYIQGDGIPIPSGENNAALNFLVSVNYISPSLWEANIEKFEIAGLATPSASLASLSLTGIANDRGLVIPGLFIDDGKGALGGSVSLNWDTHYSNFRFKADIAGNAGNEYYGLQGSYGDKRLELFLSGQGMQFSRVSAHNIKADATLRLSWESVAAFEAEATVSSLVINRQNNQIKFSAGGRMNNDMLLVNNLTMNYSGLEASVPFFSINRAASHAETEALVRGNFSGIPVDLSFRSSAGFSSTETWLDMLGNFIAFDGGLIVDTARYDSIKAEEPFNFVFSGRQEDESYTLSLSGGPKNMIRFRYASAESKGQSGSFYAAISAPSPVRGSFAGSIDSKNIDAHVPDLYVDLASLWSFMPPSVDAVMFPAGIVTGSVRIVGDLGDPEFYGTARGTSVQILVPDFITEPIRPVPTIFTLSGSEMAFGPSDAVVGRGAGKGAGLFKFEKWIPNVFTIDIQVPQETPIPYGFDISGIIAKGLIGGRLVLAMEDNIMSVGGDLTVHNTEIKLNAAEFAALENESPAMFDKNSTINVITDISIKSGRRLEFFWPTAEFPILQANADMGSMIHIISDDSSRTFSVTGDIRLRGGELFYLERNFYIREGTLFLRENETQVDPRISARAEIRDQTEDGPVTISLIIDNSPLRSFVPRFVSSPPLSQMEIYALLGQNTQVATSGGQRNLATSAVFDTLTQFAVIRQLQRQIRNFLGLDMFSVRTQVLHNVVMSVTGLQSQNTLDDRPYRAGNYFDNSTVFIGKYFGPNIFAQAMLSFKYDENKTTMGGLRLEPEIGLEMRNPLFDIQLSMVPLHPENWFIDDLSISLIWRRSF